MIISAPLTLAPHVTEGMSVVEQVFAEQLPLPYNPRTCCVPVILDGWTIDELLLHPREAALFCDGVRRKRGWYDYRTTSFCEA